MEDCILGFSQEKALFHGLEVGDLIILRWFSNIRNTGVPEDCMVKDGTIYFRVNYEDVVEAFPIRRWSAFTVRKKFAKLVNRGLLKRIENQHTYFAITPAYLNLVFGDDLP